MAEKYRCAECGRVLYESDILSVPHPWRSGKLFGCRYCGEVLDTAVVLCDEPGCDYEVTSGWPSPDGYRNTCSKHHKPTGREAKRG